VLPLPDDSKPALEEENPADTLDEDAPVVNDNGVEVVG
jgi:hypothetical protein